MYSTLHLTGYRGCSLWAGATTGAQDIFIPCPKCAPGPASCYFWPINIVVMIFSAVHRRARALRHPLPRLLPNLRLGTVRSPFAFACFVLLAGAFATSPAFAQRRPGGGTAPPPTPTPTSPPTALPPPSVSAPQSGQLTGFSTQSFSSGTGFTDPPAPTP